MAAAGHAVDSVLAPNHVGNSAHPSPSAYDQKRAPLAHGPQSLHASLVHILAELQPLVIFLLCHSSHTRPIAQFHSCTPPEYANRATLPNAILLHEQTTP